MRTILRKLEIGIACMAFAALTVYATAITSPDAIAQTYPTKPIRIIVTSTPGSGPDIIARLIGGKITEAWGQQVIVDDRAGASGRIGAEAAANSAPDGYTLMILTSQLTIVDGMYDKLNYSLTRDFSPVSMLGATPFILVANPLGPGELGQGTGGTGKRKAGDPSIRLRRLRFSTPSLRRALQIHVRHQYPARALQVIAPGDDRNDDRGGPHDLLGHPPSPADDQRRQAQSPGCQQRQAVIPGSRFAGNFRNHSRL